MIPDRLASPLAVNVSTRLGVEEAALRLRTAMDRDIGVEAKSKSDRRLAGAVLDDRTVELRVFEADWRRRRKSWNVILRGRLEESNGGSAIRGAVEVIDGNQLHLMIQMFRVLAVIPILIAAAVLFSGLGRGSVQIDAVAFGLVIGAASSLGVQLVERSGQQAAASDTGWLLERVDSVFG